MRSKLQNWLNVIVMRMRSRVKLVRCAELQQEYSCSNRNCCQAAASRSFHHIRIWSLFSLWNVVNIKTVLQLISRNNSELLSDPKVWYLIIRKRDTTQWHWPNLRPDNGLLWWKSDCDWELRLALPFTGDILPLTHRPLLLLPHHLPGRLCSLSGLLASSASHPAGLARSSSV